MDNNEKTVFSPMTFVNCPRGVGRPKKKRFGAPKLQKEILSSDNLPEVKRKRGRPAGSKNKVKSVVESVAKRPKLTMREKAEVAAAMDETKCDICEFSFDHPLKMNISRSRCETCHTLCHEPCLLKSGCIEF